MKDRNQISFNFPIMFLLDLIFAPALQSSASNFCGCFSHRTPKPVNNINGHTSYLESCKSATRLKFPASTGSSKADGLNKNTVPLMVNYELFSQQWVCRLSRINRPLILVERTTADQTAAQILDQLSYSGSHIIMMMMDNNNTIEIQCMWNVKTKVIPVIIGATRTISKYVCISV